MTWIIAQVKIWCTAKIKLKEKDTFKVFYIDVTHHLKLNTARSPCGSEFNDIAPLPFR